MEYKIPHKHREIQKRERMNFQIPWRLPISTQKKKKVCLTEVAKYYNKIIFSEEASCNYINKHI